MVYEVFRVIIVSLIMDDGDTVFCSYSQCIIYSGVLDGLDDIWTASIHSIMSCIYEFLFLSFHL